VGEVVRENHFGLIEVDWSRPDPVAALQIVDVPGTVRLRHEVALGELRFPA
jgi:hypothetical protein